MNNTVQLSKFQSKPAGRNTLWHTAIYNTFWKHNWNTCTDIQTLFSWSFST